MGLGLVTNWNIMHKIMHEFHKERGLLFLLGSLQTLFGSFLITIHTVWETYPQLIATVLVWIVFSKGVMVVLFPNLVKRQLKWIFKHDAWYYATAIIVPLMGIALGAISILA